MEPISLYWTTDITKVTMNKDNIVDNNCNVQYTFF